MLYDECFDQRVLQIHLSKSFKMRHGMSLQGRNHKENFGATTPMVGRISPPGWNRVKVSEILGATPVAPVAPVDTSLLCIFIFQ